MPTMVESLLEQLSKTGTVDKVAGRLGVEPGKANAALNSAIPAIMAGLARNVQKPEGAAALSTALEKDHDGSVLDDDGYVEHYEDRKGDKILGHVFGDNKGAVESQIAQLGGLSGGQGAELMKMLAPLVMGYLGKQKSGGGFDVAELARMLNGGNSDLAKMLPGGLGDLLGGLAGGGDPAPAAGRKPSGRGGNLGGILNGFFKKKKR